MRLQAHSIISTTPWDKYNTASAKLRVNKNSPKQLNTMAR